MYFRIIKYARPYLKHFLVAFIFATLFAVANFFFLPLMRDLTKVISSKNMRMFNLNVAYIAVLYGIRTASQFIQTYWMAYITSRLTIDLRMEMFTHIQRMSLDFFEKYRQGDIISRVVSDISAIELVIKDSFVQLIPQTFTLIGAVTYLFILNWKLAAMMFLMVPLFIYIIQALAGRSRKYTSKMQRKNADVLSVLQESLAGIRIVKAFSMENHEIKRFLRQNEQNFIFTMKNVRVNALQEPLVGFLQFLSIIFVFWFGFREIIIGNMIIADLMAFITGVFLIIEPVQALSKAYTKVQASMASAERIFGILDLIPTVTDKKDAIKVENVDGNIEFKNVSFAYDKSEGNVLDNVDFKVKTGETIALVGPSGGGKTTLVNLVARFYDVSEGALLVDGQDIRDISMASYRKFIAMVPQETILFRGSIESNIVYGKPGATRKEVEAAAKAANAEEFILKMKNKYVTRLGDSGQKLSGGQKQRIAIARAILKNPKILILDEATSALDNESEKLVQDALDKLMKGRTTFVIAHRLSTIINADRILVVDGGKIVEEGTHDMLIAYNGLYKSLYEKNFK